MLSEFSVSNLIDKNNSFLINLKDNYSLSFGHIACDSFGGENAIYSKNRIHNTEDNLSLRFENEGVIPFGCEYYFNREITLCNGFGTTNLDVRAENHGEIRQLKLEDICFNGQWEKIEFLVLGENSPRIVEDFTSPIAYDGDAPLVFVRTISKDKLKVEYYLGEDVWRHNIAKSLELCTGNFKLLVNENKVTIQREILSFDKEAKIEKRPWKFKNIFAWTNEEIEDVAENAINMSTLLKDAKSMHSLSGNTLKSCCFSAPKTMRAIRKSIRKSKENFALKEITSNLCDCAEHLGRPDKQNLLHLDLELMLKLHLWANRNLQKQNKNFRMFLNNDFITKNSAIAVILSKALLQINMPEE